MSTGPGSDWIAVPVSPLRRRQHGHAAARSTFTHPCLRLARGHARDRAHRHSERADPADAAGHGTHGGDRLLRRSPRPREAGGKALVRGRRAPVRFARVRDEPGSWLGYGHAEARAPRTQPTPSRDLPPALTE